MGDVVLVLTFVAENVRVFSKKIDLIKKKN